MRLPRPLVRWLHRGEARAFILRYHQIAELDRDPHHLAVSPSLFDQHLAVLTQRWRPATLDSIVGGLRAGSVPDRTVALTFDDGYQDFFTAALPLLRHHGVPATVFLVSDILESRGEVWWNELEPVRAAGQPHEQRHGEAHLALSPEQVVSVAAEALIAIGAHTRSHPKLSQLTPEQRWNEIEGCKAPLEAVTGYEVSAFAYPFGAGLRSAELVERAGFSSAVTTIEGPVFARTNPFLLPRIKVGNWSGEALSRVLEAWC
jgi:peptidoglycan/xylan/chitin deacetylase (PgdA/CDA1 family)